MRSRLHSLPDLLTRSRAVPEHDHHQSPPPVLHQRPVTTGSTTAPPLTVQSSLHQLSVGARVSVPTATPPHTRLEQQLWLYRRESWWAHRVSFNHFSLAGRISLSEPVGRTRHASYESDTPPAPLVRLGHSLLVRRRNGLSALVILSHTTNPLHQFACHCGGL